MDMPKSIWPPKGRAAIAAWSGGAAVAVMAIAMALAWPALTRPEPPSEAIEGRDGVRISLVQPPKAATPRGGKLDVGVSETAPATDQGPPAPSTAEPPIPSPSSRPAADLAPASTTPLLVEDDTAPPVRDWQADDRYEAGQRRRWDAEQQIREERAERRARRREERERQDGGWDNSPSLPDIETLPEDDRAPPR